jgi:hypothetical protein
MCTFLCQKLFKSIYNNNNNDIIIVLVCTEMRADAIDKRAELATVTTDLCNARDLLLEKDLSIADLNEQIVVINQPNDKEKVLQLELQATKANVSQLTIQCDIKDLEIERLQIQCENASLCHEDLLGSMSQSTNDTDMKMTSMQSVIDTNSKEVARLTLLTSGCENHLMNYEDAMAQYQSLSEANALLGIKITESEDNNVSIQLFI